MYATIVCYECGACGLALGRLHANGWSRLVFERRTERVVALAAAARATAFWLKRAAPVLSAAVWPQLHCSTSQPPCPRHTSTPGQRAKHRSR